MIPAGSVQARKSSPKSPIECTARPVTFQGVTGGVYSLSDLKSLPHWVAWKVINKQKVPINPHTGKGAKTNDPLTWGTRAQAATRKLSMGGKGIGLMLGPIQGQNDLSFGGIDLDTCRNTETGEITPWAQEIVDRLDCYTEISPSGTGLKIYFVHNATSASKQFKRKGDSHPPAIELYLDRRWFAMTNEEFGSTKPLRLINSEIYWVLNDAGPRFIGTDSSQVAATDDSKSAAAFCKAEFLLLNNGTIEDFEEWALEHPWGDYESNPRRAIERTWQNAGIKAGAVALSKLRNPVEFEDLGPDPDKPKNRHGLNSTCAADLEPENIQWVWPQRLASGKISILAGDPGQGKSQISLHLASVISSGGKWPDGGKAPKGSIVILSAEDGAADTTVPRLIAAGADRSKVYFVRSVTEKGKDRSFNLGADIQQLGELCDSLGDVVLVIIDPITSYLGNIDSHRTGDVRAVLEPLGNWAEQARVAVLAISHPPKAAQAKAINAVTGSLAFVAAARVVMVAIADPETKGRSLLLPVKINIGQSPKGLGYRIEGRTVDGATGPISTSGIAWDGDPVTLTADEAMNAGREPGRPSKAGNEAEAFLRGRLGFGAVAAKDVLNEAEAEGISERTLRRAKVNLGVIVNKSAFGGGWTWELDWGV